MVHQGVEVGGAELPVAEGALVNASSKGAIVMAGLQPEDVTSLGVEGLVVAVDVAALHVSHKNKGTKGYLRLVVDDGGVVGVLRRVVLHWFVRVPIDGGLDGGGGRCAGCYVGSSDRGLDGGGGRCAGCYVGSSDRAWTGAAADVPTMGISFFSIAGGFLRGFAQNHPNLVSLPPLPEGGEVEERAIVTDDNEETPSFVNEPVDSQKSAGSSEGTASAQSPPPAVSPKGKRKRKGVEDSGTSKAEEVDPSHKKATYDPYLASLVSSDDEEEVPTRDVAPRTSASHTLVVSETPIDGEEYSPPQQNVVTTTPPSSPLAPSPKRTRPMMKELIRIGSQFLGYREYANKIEEKLAEANRLADTLAQKLEQSETARKKAELDARQAKVEADEAKAKAASVEELQKKLGDAEAGLNEHKAAQDSREKGILKRLNTQNRRFLGQTSQDFDLENPTNDPLLDALSYLEFHGQEIREGVVNADAGLSKLFPYFFPKKEEPKTFLALAKDFNPPEDLGLKMRQENMKVAVENTIALVADSQQTVDWMKVGDTEQIEQSKWRSLIKAAKPNTKKILAYLGIKPSSTPSSSRPEV
ncbi:hypothetical protein QYE76_011075 [Lolium multiflorum]|uniref:Uncharacterized protein n=1 Tax=Lolium multiflorum TaxID=4521 RepID=A0AAD8TYG8_LOLMU|nr:hypothetical protein QYE76_011075 [Lolium multiflorum]